MAWTYELVNFGLSEPAAPSVSTSVGNKPAGTLHDGTHDESVPIDDADQLVTSSVSTSSSTVNSTHFAISSIFTPSHSTLLTDVAVHQRSRALQAHLPYPSVPSSQPRPHETPSSTSPAGLRHHEATRTYGFDLNPHWQDDKDHYDNQKINGLRFPRTIRQSAFTQELDIEGCDPLALPLAALMYQQANNFWLRKLAHGREVYLIPTREIATVVFITELLTQLRSRGVDLDRVSHSRARQDGKLLDKTNNTKYAAQQIADIIHSWVPARTTDPDTQHEITQLRNQLAELRQRAGEDPGDIHALIECLIYSLMADCDI